MNANQESNQEKIRARLETFNREITQKINNESIDIKKYDVVEKIRELVADQFSLLDIFCKLILENLSLFTRGEEKYHVNKIAQEKIISDWKNGSAATHLKEIQQSILDDERNQELLKLYVKILKIQERGGITIDDNQDRRKLLEVGIIREEKDGRVKVANPIYESVFNREWAYQNLPSLHQVGVKQNVNNNEKVSKRSMRFSGFIFIVFLLFSIIHIYRLTNEPQQLTQQQSSSTENLSLNPSLNTTQKPSDRKVCSTRRDKTDNTPDKSALAKDAQLAINEYIKEDRNDFPKLKSGQFEVKQYGCKVYIEIELRQDQDFDKKHEIKLEDVIKKAVNPDAIDKITFDFKRL